MLVCFNRCEPVRGGEATLFSSVSIINVLHVLLMSVSTVCIGTNVTHTHFVSVCVM